MVAWLPPDCCKRDGTCACADGVQASSGLNLHALEEALMQLESAAWSRSWKRLKAARQGVANVTGIKLTGRLAAMLKNWA